MSLSFDSLIRLLGCSLTRGCNKERSTAAAGGETESSQASNDSAHQGFREPIEHAGGDVDEEMEPVMPRFGKQKRERAAAFLGKKKRKHNQVPEFAFDRETGLEIAGPAKEGSKSTKERDFRRGRAPQGATAEVEDTEASKNPTEHESDSADEEPETSEDATTSIEAKLRTAVEGHNVELDANGDISELAQM